MVGIQGVFMQNLVPLGYLTILSISLLWLYFVVHIIKPEPWPLSLLYAGGCVVVSYLISFFFLQRMSHQSIHIEGLDLESIFSVIWCKYSNLDNRNDFLHIITFRTAFNARYRQNNAEMVFSALFYKVLHAKQLGCGESDLKIAESKNHFRQSRKSKGT